MICKEVHKKMNSYLSGELSGSLLKDFESHLEDCASCRQIIDEVKSTLALAKKQDQIKADPYMFIRIQAKIENRAEKRNKNWQRVLQPIAVGMIVLFGLFAGINLGSEYYNENISGQEEYMDEFGDIYFDALDFESIENLLLTEN